MFDEMKAMRTAIFTLIFLTAVTNADLALDDEGHGGGSSNDRPIIAVLAELAPPDYNVSYIAASYVKYLESSGARVVPIPSSMSDEEVATIFNSVNGVLFPGGGTKWLTSAYYHHAKVFFDKAIEANKAGDYFPIWGVCLGFETLHVLAANNGSVLGPNGAEDVNLPLNFTELAPKSRLFQNIPRELYKALATEPITYNHHKKGISPQTYVQTDVLSGFFDVLSTNSVVNGNSFVSTVEAKHYPIYGTQWHPEKNRFEFTVHEHIAHREVVVKTTQYMSNFFVGEARKSTHKFESEEMEQKYLIYNWNPVYTGRLGPERLQNFAQIYYFN